MSVPRETEVKTTKSKGYYVSGNWEVRAETPDELAARFLRMIDSFEEIDPVFSLWTSGRKRPRKFETIRDRYAEEIAAGVTTDDWGESVPSDGYWFSARTRDTPNNRSFAVRCKAGSVLKYSFTNHVTLTTSSLADPRPDAERCQLSGLSCRAAGDRGCVGTCSGWRLFPTTNSAIRQRLLFPGRLDSIPLSLARRENHAAFDGVVRVFAERRAVDVGHDGNLRCRQPRASQSRARHGRRDGAARPFAVAVATRVNSFLLV